MSNYLPVNADIVNAALADLGDRWGAADLDSWAAKWADRASNRATMIALGRAARYATDEDYGPDFRRSAAKNSLRESLRDGIEFEAA